MLLLLFISPIAAILLSLLVKKQRSLIETIAIASVCVELIAVISIIFRVLNQHSYSFSEAFSVGSFEALLLAVTTTIGVVATFHSVGYLRVEQAKEMIGFKRVKEYYILINLFLLCMFVAISTTNPVMMWIAVEATTLSTVFLVSFFNRKEDIEAAWKYLIINSVGLLLGLLGTILFLAQGSLHDGFVSWNDLLKTAAANPLLIKFAFIFILIGYGTKMGLVPMHTWKPDAYNKAPLPIVALLSGALLNVAFLAILRFKLITDNIVGKGFSQDLFIFLGAISIVVTAFIIYSQNNYKRLFAYSSIEHAGIMLLGFGFGGLGVIGAILHMTYHAFAKSLLFLASSNIAVRYSSSKIQDVKGMLTTMPYTTLFFVIGLFVIIGIPPSGIFFSELYILLSGFSNHLIITIAVTISLVLIVIGFLRQGFSMIFGEAPPNIKKGETDLWTIVPIAIMAVVLLLLGLYLPNFLQNLIKDSALLFTNKI